MKLIGISGKAKSGKNLVGNILNILSYWKHNECLQGLFPNPVDYIMHTLNNGASKQIVDYRFISFANRLKGCLASVFPPYQFNNWEDQEYKASKNSSNITKPNGELYTNRELLQAFGEFGRSLDPNFWIKLTLDNLYQHNNYIVTDVRYVNEADAILERGGLLIRVNRPDSEDMQHISETELDNYEYFDVVIDNNGSIEDLINKILKLNLV